MGETKRRRGARRREDPADRVARLRTEREEQHSRRVALVGFALVGLALGLAALATSGGGRRALIRQAEEGTLLRPSLEDRVEALEGGG